MSSSVFPYPNTCIPGGLAQISYQPSPSRSPSPMTVLSPASALETITQSSNPHPYSISPSNTTALFTRASSVTANGGAIKKARAPPSGPISTKDFIPPDVSGLSKREARLVKNRAAAFLSRQRKREEFELLEVRCDALEQENAQLKSLLNGGHLSTESPEDTQAELAAIQRQFTSELESIQASHALELVSLQNKLAQASQELSVAKTKLEKAVARESALKGQVSGASRQTDLAAPTTPSTVVSAFEDSEAEEEDSSSKKSAGSMAFMVLLFSLSTLLTNGQQQQPTRGRTASATSDVIRPSLRSRSPSFGLGYPGLDALASSTSFGSSSGADFLSYQPSAEFSLDSLLSSTSNPLTGFLSDDALLDLTSGPSAAQFEDFLLAPSSLVPSSPSLSATSAESTTSTIVNDLTRQCEMTGGVPSNVKCTGPNSFEFVVEKPEQKTSVRVCVKSNVPFPKFQVPTTLEGASGSSKDGKSLDASTLGTTIPSPLSFLPDDDLDSLVDFDADFEMKDWLSDDATTTAPSPLPTPTLKRKQVVVELNKRPMKKLRQTSPSFDDASDDIWDINFTEHDEEVSA